MKLTRRYFLAGGAAFIGAVGFGQWMRWKETVPPVPGEIVGASSSIGHRLRMGELPALASTETRDIVIIGGGISGLAAGYRLAKTGADFLLLDLEKQTGGNSSSGKNDVSAYPWGAHYVPLVNEEATEVKELFTELGIITGEEGGLPIYNEYHLCADPHERLYRYGKWQEGLVPSFGIPTEEEAQYKRFFSRMEEYRKMKGKDGRRAFAIPVELSSQDAELLALDGLTMEAWLAREGLTSSNLGWYVNYCCRDDYGATTAETSAWAGIHYFASRDGRAANASAQNVLTWPEGNGWLAHKLAEPVKDNIQTQALAYRLTRKDNGIAVDYWNEAEQRSARIEAKAVIIAAPRFVAARLYPELSMEGFSYAPWAVANITLGRMPAGNGAPLSWDNMIYGSELLGYVNATHQIPQMDPTRTVLTYYWPLSHLAPAEARTEALSRTYAQWQEIFLKELYAIHPEVKGHVERLDVWLWGHAMIRPTPGFIWGEARRAALKQHPPVFTAHSDMSGISIFEEAYTRGYRTAELVLTYLKDVA